MGRLLKRLEQTSDLSRYICHDMHYEKLLILQNIRRKININLKEGKKYLR